MAFQVASKMLFFSVSSPPLKSYKNRYFNPLKDSMENIVTKVQTGKRPLSLPHKVHMQVSYSMPPEKMEIFNNLESWARETILPLLKPVEKCWQPEDFLPEPSTEEFYDDVREIQLQANEIPDDYFVCLVGNMITEEALPTYQKVLNMMDPVRDDTGVSPMSWAIWSRGWSAEENRHGDLLNKYLYLTGRVDMKMIEKTIQYLIGSGMTLSVEQDMYLTFIYTSFQERATFISHSNTARHAKEYGDFKLAQICGIIASDEKRHETAYTKIVKKLFEIDPDNTLLALANLMQERIVMPANMMYDGSDNDLFKHFCMVSQRLQIYTAKDYADVLEFLVAQWKVGDLVDLSGEGRRAQDYVCTLAPRIRRIAERVHEGRAKERKTMPFSWVHGREVVL